jgi:hypothetical protein
VPHGPAGTVDRPARQADRSTRIERTPHCGGDRPGRLCVDGRFDTGSAHFSDAASGSMFTGLDNECGRELPARSFQLRRAGGGCWGPGGRLAMAIGTNSDRLFNSPNRAPTARRSGSLRFVVQPLTAILLGIGSGLADSRAGRPPCLCGVLFQFLGAPRTTRRVPTGAEPIRPVLDADDAGGGEGTEAASPHSPRRGVQTPLVPGGCPHDSDKSDLLRLAECEVVRT